MSDAPSEFDPVEVLADSFLERYRRGERPSLSEYVHRHPELAEQIRELFPALVVVEELGSVGNLAGLTPKLGTSSVPLQLGEYRILREIGRGGMGIVYEAVQGSLGRHVALKVLPFHGLMNPMHLERFRREARAAARLHHTNIVPVFGVGEDAGIHYYAMQFIHGQGLNEVLQEVKRLRLHKEATPPAQSVAASVAENLLSGQFAFASASGGRQPSDASSQGTDAPRSPEFQHSNLSSQPEARYFRQVAQIGVQVAEALEYAHGEGVLHRDIKPSNLLLDVHGRVWVTDFGLAKTEETEEVTDPGDIVGTLCYMAPERFQGRADARSDVYGLGITLYELATLHAAFADTQRAGLIEKVAHEEPPRPRKLDPKIPRDLEIIILKAIAKEPSQRFATARALAEDLRRFLADRPIQARRTSLRERLWRWCRRNPLIAGLAGFVALLLVVIAAGSLLMASWTVQANEQLRKESAATLEEQKRAERAEKEVQDKRLDSFLANLGKARSIRLSHQAGQRFDCLKALGAAADLARSLNLGYEHVLDLRNEAIACSILPDLQVTRRWETQTPWINVDARLERYVCLDGQGTISVRRFADNRELVRLPRPVPSFWGAVPQFDPTGRYLAVQFDISKQPSQLCLWDLSEGGSAPKVKIAGWSLLFCPEQPLAVVVLADGSLSVCDLHSWKTRPLRSAGLMTPRREVPFDLLGRQIALANRDDHRVRIVDVESDTASVVGTLPASMDPWCLAWSRDGKKMALANHDDSRIYVYRVADWQLWRVLEGHQAMIFGLAFAPCGDLLASESWDGFSILWDMERGRKLLSAPGYFLGFGPAGKQLAFRDHTQVGIWQVTPGAEFAVLDQPANSVDFSTDGRLLASAGEGVGIWDVASRSELAHLPLGSCASVAFHPDGKNMVTCGDRGGYRWPIQTDLENLHYRIGPPQRFALPKAEGVAFASNGFWGIAAKDRLVLDPGPRAKERALALSQIHRIGLSPDGHWAATTVWNGSGVRLWDLAQPALRSRPVFELPSGQNNHSNPAFSPDGQWLVVTSIDAHRFWRVGSWQLSRQLPRDRIEPYGGPVAFSPDGRLLALCRTSQLIQLVDPSSYRELATLHAPEPANIHGLAFTRDGRCLAVACQHRCIQLWHLRAIRQRLATLGLDWDDAGDATHFAREPESSPLPSGPSLPTTPIQLQANLGHLPFLARAEEHERRRDYERMLAALQQVVKMSPAETKAQAAKCNELAWQLVAGPKADRDPAKALPLAETAVGWVPQECSYLNTLGVVYYRLGRYPQALSTLERCLHERQGKLLAFDLFFLAMSHARLGNSAQAKECYDQAVKWLAKRNDLSANSVRELREFQAEAQGVLGSVSKH
jgi:serine/threonine protein kinase/WD40 repeat protein